MVMPVAHHEALLGVVGGAPLSSSNRSMQYVLDRAANGPRPHQRIRDAILLSWRRSADAGLVPSEIHAPFHPDVDTGGRLRWAAAPAMAAVSRDLGAIEVALLLTDSHGQIVERWAFARAAQSMDRIGAAVGFVCDEALVG